MSQTHMRPTILENPLSGRKVKLTANRQEGLITVFRSKGSTFRGAEKTTYGFEDDTELQRKYGYLMFDHMAKGFHLVEQDNYWFNKWIDVRFRYDPMVASILFSDSDDSKYWFGAQKPFLHEGWLYVNPIDEHGHTVLRFMRVNMREKLSTQIYAIDKLVQNGVNASYSNYGMFPISSMFTPGVIDLEMLGKEAQKLLDLLDIKIRLPRAFSLPPHPHFVGF